MTNKQDQSRVDELSNLMTEILKNPLKPLHEQIISISNGITKSQDYVLKLKTDVKNVSDLSDEILEQGNQSFSKLENLATIIEHINRSSETIQHVINEIAIAEKNNEAQIVELNKRLHAFEQQAVSKILEFIQSSHKTTLQHQRESIIPLIENAINSINGHSSKQNDEVNSILVRLKNQHDLCELIHQDICKASELNQNQHSESTKSSTDISMLYAEHNRSITELCELSKKTNYLIESTLSGVTPFIDIQNQFNGEIKSNSANSTIEDSNRNNEWKRNKFANEFRKFTDNYFPFLIWIIVITLIINSALTIFNLSH